MEKYRYIYSFFSKPYFVQRLLQFTSTLLRKIRTITSKNLKKISLMYLDILKGSGIKINKRKDFFFYEEILEWYKSHGAV